MNTRIRSVVAALACVIAPFAARAAEKPNIIVILVEPSARM
jgi:hypothetical protein